MNRIDQIKVPVREEMEKFEKSFGESMKSKVSLLDHITRYILKRKGKQIRPLFVFLSAGLFGKPNESAFRGAALIELLHTATLVHDDVVDDSNMRRGFFSVNALWKNKIAVLVGDYLLSRGLLLAVDHQEFQLLRIVSDSVREMSEGELLQIEKARKLDIEEAIYFEIIRKKTASLIASCCAVGAASNGANLENVEKMRKFGEMVGIAFQIKDDLLDLGSGSKTGKPAWTDLKESKFTLPLIHALKNSTWSESRKIKYAVKNNLDEPGLKEKVANFILKNKGFEYTERIMLAYRDQALSILESYPTGPYRESLAELVKFSTEREK